MAGLRYGRAGAWWVRLDRALVCAEGRRLCVLLLIVRRLEPADLRLLSCNAEGCEA